MESPFFLQSILVNRKQKTKQNKNINSISIIPLNPKKGNTLN